MAQPRRQEQDNVPVPALEAPRRRPAAGKLNLGVAMAVVTVVVGFTVEVFVTQVRALPVIQYTAQKNV